MHYLNSKEQRESNNNLILASFSDHHHLSTHWYLCPCTYPGPTRPTILIHSRSLLLKCPPLPFAVSLSFLSQLFPSFYKQAIQSPSFRKPHLVPGPASSTWTTPLLHDVSAASQGQPCLQSRLYHLSPFPHHRFISDLYFSDCQYFYDKHCTTLIIKIY